MAVKKAKTRVILLTNVAALDGHNYSSVLGLVLAYMVVSRTCTGGAAVGRMSKEVLAGAATPLLFTVVLSLALV